MTGTYSERRTIVDADNGSTCLDRVSAVDTGAESPSTCEKLKILLLCHWYEKRNASVNKHIETLATMSSHEVVVCSMITILPNDLDLDRFDVIVIHFSLAACRNNFINPESRLRLAKARATKVIFIQDEYRHVHQTVAAFRVLGISAIFTCVPPDEVEKVYSERDLPGVRKVTVLTGYVPEGLANVDVPEYADRPIDIAYRGRDLPAWLGELAQEKVRIGERFARDARRYGLITDIAWREQDRVYGEDWIHFMSSCKATLGVESGASVFDFTRDIQTAVESHVSRQPDITFEELQRLHFADKEGLIRINQISPRCFDAACLRTLMILYEGEYSGILQPWRHFVPLRKDHSNMDEVVRVVQDEAAAAEIIDNAYREVACNPRFAYRRLAETFDDALESMGIRPRRAAAGPLTVPGNTDTKAPSAFNADEIAHGPAIFVPPVSHSRHFGNTVREIYSRSAIATMARIENDVPPALQPGVITLIKVPKDAIVGLIRMARTVAVWLLKITKRMSIATASVFGLWRRYGDLAIRSGVPVRALLHSASQGGSLAIFELGNEMQQLATLEATAGQIPGVSRELIWDADLQILVREVKVGVSPFWNTREPCSSKELVRNIRRAATISLVWRFQDPWDLLPDGMLAHEVQFPRLAKILSTYPARLIREIGPTETFRIKLTPLPSSGAEM